MSDSGKKSGPSRGGRASPPGKPGGAGKLPAAGLGKGPGLRRLVVQFKPAGDPTAEQTDAVRSILKRFPRKAAVRREFPGAINIEVEPDVEEELRRSIDALEEWGVGGEGQAAMPDEPIPEE